MHPPERLNERRREVIERVGVEGMPCARRSARVRRSISPGSKTFPPAVAGGDP
jgi:hypothetical protein